jgi:tetratricopeptide (TPR) repeat protein
LCIDSRRAAESYEHATQQFKANDPNAYISFVQLGRAQALLGENAAASAALRLAISLDSRSPWAYLEMAALQHQRKEDARDFIEEARISAPDEAQVDLRLAQLCLEWGDYACAQTAYLSAEKKRPASGWLQGQIGAFYQPQTPPLAHQSWEEAREHYAKAVAWRPQDPWAHERLGYVLFYLDDIAGAAEHYQKAIDLAPIDAIPARLHCDLGRLLQKQSEIEPARKQYELCELTASNAAERDKARLLLEQIAP